MLKFIGALVALSGCYIKSYPVSPEIVERSTYQAWNLPDVSGMYSQGTAWAVEEHHLFTAGHLCEDAQLPDGGFVAMELHRGPYVIKATPVYSSVGAPSVDACLMKTEASLTPVILADRLPDIGAPVWSVGYPLGMLVTSYGTFNGLDPYVGVESAMFSDHGQSGAPVFSSEGVIGLVITGCHDDLLDVKCTGGTPVTELRRILDEMKVGYTLTPHMPTDE